MNIAAVMTMTLLDFPGHVACTAFLGGCDFNCPYCHNSAIAHKPAHLWDEDKFFRYLAKRKGMLDGVAISGGEPCLNDDLPDFIQKIKERGFLVKLDTNGNHPDMLARVLPMVDYVAMDIKAGIRNYVRVIDVGENRAAEFLARVQHSADLLLHSEKDYEFRTTVVRPLHTEEDFESIGPWIRGAKHYFLQYFKDSMGVVYDGFSAFSQDEMERFAEIVRPYVQDVQIRG